MKTKIKKGFSLIELLVVIVIIGILSTLGISAYSSYITKANDTKNNAIAKQISNTITMVFMDDWSASKFVIPNGNSSSPAIIEKVITTQGIKLPKYTNSCLYYGYSSGNDFFIAGWEENADKLFIYGTADGVNAVEGLSTPLVKTDFKLNNANSFPTSYTKIEISGQSTFDTTNDCGATPKTLCNIVGGTWMDGHGCLACP